jgi:ATP-dependent DNA helicase RecG
MCKKENAPFPEIELTENYFYVTFKQSHVYLQMAQKQTPQKTTQKIVELIKQNPSITRKELSERLGLTEDGVKFHLNKLKEKKVIKRIGPDKGGHWEVVQ